MVILSNLLLQHSWPHKRRCVPPGREPRQQRLPERRTKLTGRQMGIGGMTDVDGVTGGVDGVTHEVDDRRRRWALAG